MNKPKHQKMGHVALVGAGPGDPGLITARGLQFLREADVVVYDRLVSEALLAECRLEAERIYVGKASGKHILRQPEINLLLARLASEGKQVVRLKGGDPFIFGRGGEEAARLARAGVPFTIVPGISSAIAAATYAGIPVTHRKVATSFAVFTGHEDEAKTSSTINWAGLANGADTLVCLMGVENLEKTAAHLTANGRAAETPAALIEWGTWARQRTLVATLGTIAKRAEAEAFSAPAVLVVGDVVRLREELRWFDNRPLSGKRILVTRTRAQASVLSKQLADRGAQAVEIPAIRIEPPDDWSAADGAIASLHEYTWLVFTSANGVTAFFDRLDVSGLDARELGEVKVAAIGPATAETLRAHGIRADLIPAEYVAEALAARMLTAGVSDARVLIARAQDARDALPEALRRAGAEVNVVPVYKTVPITDVARRVAKAREEGKIDVITFASSSAVRNLRQALGSELDALAEEALIACIGPISAETARAAGLPVDIVASEYTIPGLVTAIEESFAAGLTERGSAGLGTKTEPAIPGNYEATLAGWLHTIQEESN